jgi:hypothetical protein
MDCAIACGDCFTPSGRLRRPAPLARLVERGFSSRPPSPPDIKKPACAGFFSYRCHFRARVARLREGWIAQSLVAIASPLRGAFGVLRRCAACRTRVLIKASLSARHKKARLRGPFYVWRRGRDSNPRYAINVNTISNRAHSTTLPPLRSGWDAGWAGVTGPHSSGIGGDRRAGFSRIAHIEMTISIVYCYAGDDQISFGLPRWVR